MPIHLSPALPQDIPEVTTLIGELLGEIMQATDPSAFHFDANETAQRLDGFLREGSYFVFVARNGAGEPIGFAALYEARSLYAEGRFGVLAELYVRPRWRSEGAGHALIEHARSFGREHGWKRLEVTTPPLPQFDRTLAFYEREGFSITGGRKLKTLLQTT
ncbi:MAG: GNAT family N-acetyltransferase [Acidithiobacillus sp.]|nr:GNAT family N-acetyltransferase [Acidithiobacillus sp.]